MEPKSLADPFNFVGKHILVAVPDEVFTQIFLLGEPRPGNDGVWVLGGQVAGEIGGTGFWLTVRTFTSPKGTKFDAAVGGERDPTYLIRWEHVVGARIVSPDFKAAGKVGFRLELPE